MNESRNRLKYYQENEEERIHGNKKHTYVLRDQKRYTREKTFL